MTFTEQELHIISTALDALGTGAMSEQEQKTFHILRYRLATEHGSGPFYVNAPTISPYHWGGTSYPTLNSDNAPDEL